MEKDQRERVLDTIVHCTQNPDREFLSRRSDEALIETLQIIARAFYENRLKENESNKSRK